jgi:hypothetical protein
MYVTRHKPHITRHTSHVTRQTSHVTRRTSHVTRHTPHATRHTSHVTRHTSDCPYYMVRGMKSWVTCQFEFDAGIFFFKNRGTFSHSRDWVSGERLSYPVALIKVTVCYPTLINCGFLEQREEHRSILNPVAVRVLREA